MLVVGTFVAVDDDSFSFSSFLEEGLAFEFVRFCWDLLVSGLGFGILVLVLNVL